MPDRFREHRQCLGSRIGNTAAALIPASEETIRNDDVTHEFRQNSEFFYLTGFHEPDAVALLVPGHPEGDYHLFVRPRDRDLEIWNGLPGRQGRRQGALPGRSGLRDRRARLGPPRLLVGRERLFYRSGNGHDDRVSTPLIKKARELSQPHRKVACRPPSSTWHHFSARCGCANRPPRSKACAPPVPSQPKDTGKRCVSPIPTSPNIRCRRRWNTSGGKVGRLATAIRRSLPRASNACILHYIENDRMIEDGDLILIDAACEVDYFSSDITRTFPANGSFYRSASRDLRGGARRAEGIHRCDPAGSNHPHDARDFDGDPHRRSG